jgi:hypothetical protein
MSLASSKFDRTRLFFRFVRFNGGGGIAARLSATRI